MRKLLNFKMPGFMARTHAMLSIILMAICMLIPLDLFKKTFWVLKEDILLFIVALIMLTGASLMPDLDNNISAAQNRSGVLGSIFTIFMQSTSSIMWTVYHWKDQKPISQHRYLWHTPFVGIGLTLLLYLGLPNYDFTIFQGISQSIRNKEFGQFILNNATLFLFIILAFMSVLIGSSIILSRLDKFITIPWPIKYILPAASLIYIFTTTFSNLKILGFCIGMGYLFHILEDFFADSGVPLIWPIPAFWCKQIWWRAKFPITVKTGGLANTIIDFVSFFIAIGLMIFVFVNK